jgi:hypothetical protein
MRPINLHTFIHDSVSAATLQKLKAVHFDHFTQELATISERAVRVHIHQHIPGVTDFDYTGTDVAATVNEWNRLASQYAYDVRITSYQTDRYLLIIEGFIHDRVAGIAQWGGKTGNSLIASTIDSTTIAHEVGHTFTARHSGIMQSPNPVNRGQVCSSYMATGEDEGPCNLYRYSTINRERIQNFLDKQD